MPRFDFNPVEVVLVALIVLLLYGKELLAAARKHFANQGPAGFGHETTDSPEQAE